MARIRSIKPEFWDSPSTAKAGPWSRLLFIAMWNWADDYGRGTANLKELEGFAFPNDSTFTDMHGNTVHFRELVAEVSECFGVVFYTSGNRPYYAIPSWETHQRNERRAKQSKYPPPPASPQVSTTTSEPVAEPPRNDTEIPHTSGPGTGEEGNRGTDKERDDSADAETPDHPQAIHLCEVLQTLIVDNGSKKPEITKTWVAEARRMIEIDKRDPIKAERLLRWAQANSFWRPNIMSMPKFRKQYDQLRLQANEEWQKSGKVTESGDIDPDGILGPDNWSLPSTPDDLDPDHYQIWAMKVTEEHKRERYELAKQLTERRSA